MDQVTWLFVGGIALLTTTGVLITAVDEIVFGVGGIILWAIWGWGATNLEIITESGAIVQRSYPELAIVALGLIVLNLVVVSEGKLAFLNPLDDSQPREMKDWRR